MKPCKDNLKTVVSIFSAGHCGSTLLSLLIGAHSNSFYAGEFHALPKWINDNNECGCGKRMAKCRFWEEIRTIYKKKYKLDIFINPKKLKVYEILNRDNTGIFSKRFYRSLSYYGTINSLFSPIRYIAYYHWKRIVKNTINVYKIINELTNSIIIVDSTKSYLRTYYFYKNYPELIKLIFLVRDGRAFCYSHKKNSKLSIESAAKTWKNTYFRGRRILSQIPDENRFFIKYEDLCNNPEKQTKRIARFLNIDYEPQMLNISSGVAHSIAGNEMKWNTNTRIKLIEDWKKGLSTKEIEKFELVAGDINHQFGYPHFDQY